MNPASVGTAPLLLRVNITLPSCSFQLLDAVRERGLTHSERDRRTHEAAVFRQGDEVTEVLQFEGHAANIWEVSSVCMP